ncbi:MAG: TonB-dependent receptor plug domain-containing protein [Xanthobacteraceae bacterium]
MVLCTFGSAPGLAQVIPLPELVINANLVPMPSEKVGSAVTVITGEELRQREIPTLADALRFVPGLVLAQTGGRGTLTTVMMRGMDARHLMVLVDGIEVNQLGFPGFDFADFLTEDIERIEVIRGPQSGLYGANAQAGVIAITTRTGRGMKGGAAEAKVEGGSRNTAAGAANLRGAAGPFYGSLTAQDYSTGGYNISRFGSERDGSRGLILTSKAGVDFNQYFNVEGVVRYTDRKAFTDPQDFRFGSPTFGFVIDGDAASTYKSTASRIGGTLTSFEGHWIQTASLKVFDEHTRGFQDRALIFGADGMRTTVDYKSTFLFDTAIVGGERHSVTFLAENRREDYIQVFSRDEFIKERTSFAGEYILDLATNTTLTGAVRQDLNSAFEDALTWRATLAQRFPTTGTRLHASVGTGVTDPDVFQLFGSDFNFANPGLTPEQSTGWDAGIEQSFFDRRIVADVTYFSIDFTNKIELTFDAARAGFVYVNGTGVATRRGVEVAATYNMLDWLAVKATYTFTDAKNSEGDPEVRRPHNSASLDATARFWDNRAKATVGVVYNGVRKDFFFTDAGTALIDLPGATVVRAILAYDITPGLTAYIRGENIFNAHYEEVFSYRAPGAAVFAGIRGRFGG